MSTSDRVVVTGASGFIASHIIQQLLEAGYRVRGTVRNLKDEHKIQGIKNLWSNPKYPLELVEADLNQSDCWVNAVNGCSHVIHVASQVSENSPNNDSVIKAEVDGTLNVLKACKDVHTVKRVVLTSSFCAVSMGSKDEEKCYNESDWLDTTQNFPVMIRSKAIVEKAAWDFVKDEKMELAVVNPGLVFGPIIMGNVTCSTEMPKKMLQGKMPVIPNVQLPIVDVRDVAAAHIKAMEVAEAAGNRHILSAGNMWFQDISNTISEEFKPQGYNVKGCEPPLWLLKIIGFFCRDVRNILPLMGNKYTVDNTRMTFVLGVKPRDIKVSILDMCYGMIENGMVMKTQGYMGPYDVIKTGGNYSQNIPEKIPV